MGLLLQQRRLRWLGRVSRMSDGRIPQDLLYGQLGAGSRAQGRPKLRFRDVCKIDLKSLDIDVNTWEDLAADRSRWRHELHTGLARSEFIIATEFTIIIINHEINHEFIIARVRAMQVPAHTSARASEKRAIHVKLRLFVKLKSWAQLFKARLSKSLVIEYIY